MDQTNFKKIPGSPIAYWVGNQFIESFSMNPLSRYGEIITGMTIGDNNKYLRLWFEVNRNGIALNQPKMEYINLDITKWIPYSKGGQRRNWYGNYDYVVNWQERKNFNRPKTTMQHLYLRKAITWPFVTSGNFSARELPVGSLWDVAGSPCFFENEYDEKTILAFLCSKVADYILKVINPTINVQAIDIRHLCLNIDDNLRQKCYNFAITCCQLAKNDWNSYESSWDFTVNPLVKQLGFLWDATGVGATIHEYYGHHVKVNSNMELCYHLWKIECNNRFRELKENEEEINRIFIDIYGLQDELTSEVSDKDVTVHYVVDSKDDIPKSFEGSNYVRTKQDEIKSFISYAVGCMFGRYSLDVDGLAYAGGEWDDSKYKSFIPDQDDIIPIYEDEFYGDDDITGRFIDFVRVAFGEDDLEANLTFIADSLGGKGSPRKVIRDYFINDFFKDHCQMYQVTGSGKRPIYWQFDSGKKNGFKALVYIHRYKPDLIARMRTEYVHPQQARYRTQINMLENQIGSVSKSDEIRIKKEIQTIKAKADELAIYEEKIHHWADKMEPMDLDDGVVNNYNKFQELLVPNVVKKPKEK